MKKLQILRITILAICFSFAMSAYAKEGMWLPYLLKQLNEGEMQSMGMKLSAEDIYSVNQSSLKDAVLIFGGGCTGELISNQGLLLTNHHCGYGEIQSHSSVEHDYLTDGFWAMSKEEELPNPGLTVTFIIRMEDVTAQLQDSLSKNMSEDERNVVIRRISKRITTKAEEGTHYDAEVRPFYQGNQFVLIITETYKDVRLVGAPPSSVGKFGFDTDNWVWPRHTGDFSMFRIYADSNNLPAEYSPNNVPFTPRHHLPVQTNGYKEDDFTMVFGFPGRTEEYLPSPAVSYVLDHGNPAKISMRDESLEIIGKWMDSDKKINIQYAAKQSRISNAWKKWIGQSKGLKQVDAIGQKQALEEKFQTAVDGNPAWKEEYGSVLEGYTTVYGNAVPYMLGRDLLIEYFYYGPEIIRFASRFEALAEEGLSEEKQQAIIEKLKAATKGHFKNYQKSVDEELFLALSKLYVDNLNQDFVPVQLAEILNSKNPIAELYENTIFSSEEEVMNFLDDFSTKKVKKLQKDQAYVLQKDVLDTYLSKIKPKYNEYNNELSLLNRTYMKGLMEVLPKEQVYYPDANFSLRVTYGQVNGYKPRDGVEYEFYTTADGILEKMDNSTKEFAVPEKLAGLIREKQFGNYADENGDLRVCFIGSNHTTGGNSGSPAINANGELIGLNFDRTWESTMSDIMYDATICRNIMVDIRYVLFIIDEYAEADHLIDELTLVK